MLTRSAFSSSEASTSNCKPVCFETSSRNVFNVTCFIDSVTRMLSTLCVCADTVVTLPSSSTRANTAHARNTKLVFCICFLIYMLSFLCFLSHSQFINRFYPNRDRLLTLVPIEIKNCKSTHFLNNMQTILYFLHQIVEQTKPNPNI